MTMQNKICVEKLKQYLEEEVNYKFSSLKGKKKNLKARFKASTLQ